MNPDSVADDQTAFSDYEQLAAECIFHHAMIKVDSSTGEIEETKTPDSDCIYFFVTFDHGLRQMADVFSKQMVDGQSTSFTAEMFRMCLRTFIAHSLSNRTDTKEGWQQLANETSSDDCWKEIMFTLRFCQSHGGQQKDSRTLDELLIGDKGRLKALIKDYLSENPGTSRLAYLLYALRQSNHIEPCNYITFHRALQSIANKPLGGPDVPQRRYHELLADPKLLGSKGKKWQQAKAIIDRWTVLFGKKDI